MFPSPAGPTYLLDMHGPQLKEVLDAVAHGRRYSAEQAASVTLKKCVYDYKGNKRRLHGITREEKMGLHDFFTDRHFEGSILSKNDFGKKIGSEV